MRKYKDEMEGVHDNTIAFTHQNMKKNSEPIKYQCCPHIETNQLICCANQLTGFCMRAILGFNGLMDKVSFLNQAESFARKLHFSTSW